MPSNIERIAAIFPTDIAQHRLEIKLDQGLHRHLRCARPNDCNKSFHIVTWPMYLAYAGDMGSFVFCRIDDMFRFHRGNGFDAGYWHEKLEAVDRCDGARKYSDQVAREWVARELNDHGASSEAREAAQHIRYDDGESELRRQLSDFASENDIDDEDLFCNACEANFTDYTFRYIWACHAIQWAIARYDEAKAAPVVGAGS